MEIRADEANSTHLLYEASMRGCVATLNRLIQNDPFILHKISLTSFAETPLHISALLGHVEFTKALLSQKPELVTELDSFKRSSLHLASAEGHKEIVKELLRANKNVCLVADQEGRIPLHLAAMRGRVEVIQELVNAKPESILVQLHGDTVLHLCVRYNHLDALKLLLASVSDEEFLNLKNDEGNSILQVSAMLKQLETASYLLSVPQIRVDVNSLIENGFAAFDANTNGTIQNNLQKPVVARTTAIQSNPPPKKSKATIRKEAQLVAAQSSFNLNKKFFWSLGNNWYEKTRGNLMVVATVIAAMSFQVATNTPGGYWETDINNQTGQSCPKGTCKAGTSINAYTQESEYHIHIIFSTLSFSASLSIILLFISGVPLRNKISVGILIIGMWAAVLLVAAAYYFSISLVQAPNDQIFDKISNYYPLFWAVLLFAILLIHILRFCWWLMKKLFICMICVVRFCFWPVKKLFKLTGKNKQQPDQPILLA